MATETPHEMPVTRQHWQTPYLPRFFKSIAFDTLPAAGEPCIARKSDGSIGRTGTVKRVAGPSVEVVWGDSTEIGRW